MADAALLGFLTEALLGKAFSLAADEFSLTFGVNKELKKLAEKLELIQALLSDAQRKQLDSDVVKLWLKKLKFIARDAQIVLDDFGYEVLRQKIQRRKRDKVRSFFSSSMGRKIRGVLTSLDNVYAESNQIGLHAVGLINSLPDLNKAIRLTNPFVEESEIVGRDDDASEVIRMLTESDNGKDLPVITILGMGGQGKTTLAQVVYKDEKVGSYFEKKVWVCVSDDFNVGRLLAQMLESLTQTTCQLSSIEGLVNKLKVQLSGKRFLVVLDDVWNESRDEWDVMRRCLLEIGGSEGSKIMASTRSEDVASAMRTSGYHRLQILSEDQSLALFEICAFAEGGATRSPELVELAKRILKRCGGVPLAIKAVGGLLYSKESASEWSVIERSDLWSIGCSGVLTAIKLSFDHLPSHSLKQCFAYCAIFPKDTKLEKDKLVQLWMAQGFLNPPKGSQLQMEDMGDMYFNLLLRSSLLQDAKRKIFNELTCKMHDLVHDFALQVSEICCIDMREANVGNSEIDAVHLRAISDHNVRHDKSLKGIVSSKLRSLTLDGWFQLDDWFDNFRCLTTLTIDLDELEKLPKAIGKMTHLRFLDISSTRVHTLPKSFVELYYLETLRCDYLSELPEGFANLINLRHLYTAPWAKEVYLIPGLSQMTNIQTLPFFKVDKAKGCRIEELEHLDNLRGTLIILGLENVSDFESASRSKLSNKSRIQRLKLHWKKREHDCDDTEVMEGLKPHSRVETLTIDGYQSPHFPSWIAMLRHLKEVALKNLDKCEQLPSFGDLPYLEVLDLTSLRNLKCIGKEFYGWSNFDWTRKSSSSNVEEITLFPTLKRLSLYDLDSLKEWSDAITPTHSSVKAFPFLETVYFEKLPNLSLFPNLGSLPCLRELGMIDCPNLSLFPNFGSLPCLRELYMRDCPNLALPSDWNNPLPHKLKAIHSSVDKNNNRGIHYLSSLHSLDIVCCDKLVAPFCSLNTLASLKTLRIWGDASFWPKDLHNLINLESLTLSIFPLPDSVSTAMHSLGDIQYPFSLRSLTLIGWSKITSLPDQIQYLTTLRDLCIEDFEGLEALPEWLCNLKCLERLELLSCKNLKQFPSAEALKSLTNLKLLEVTDCPLLKERYAEEGGPEWHTIAHIPKIIFRSQ